MRIGEFELTEPVPDLNRPHVLAAVRPWFDAGSVGTLSLGRIEDHLLAAGLGCLARPGRYYDFTRYRPSYRSEQGSRDFLLANSVIYYSLRETGQDLIFLHLLEPHLYGEDYVDSVLELLKFFKASSYALVGGMYDFVPHSRPLLLSSWGGSQTGEDATPSVSALHKIDDRQASITDLIAPRAAELGIETKTYAVHLPRYLQLKEDQAGVARVMEALCADYDLPSSLIDQAQGEQQYAEMESQISETEGGETLVRHLEDRYDEWQRELEIPSLPLPPKVEEFLRELG